MTDELKKRMDKAVKEHEACEEWFGAAHMAVAKAMNDACPWAALDACKRVVKSIKAVAAASEAIVALRLEGEKE